jgi:hypothetical protein
MGEAKRRGTYEERKAKAMATKKPEVKTKSKQQKPGLASLLNATFLMGNKL